MSKTGTVKFFNTDKGYGFIQPDDGSDDSFVHISAVQAAGMNSLDKDQRLNYEVETGRNGKASAINLSAADYAPAKVSSACSCDPARGRGTLPDDHTLRSAIMSQTFEFYDTRAREAAVEAEAATLDNVKERSLRAEKTWRGLANQARKVKADRERHESERLAARQLAESASQ